MSEDLKTQFDAFVAATEKRLAALEEAVAGGKKGSATPSKAGTLTKPKTPSKPAARPGSAADKKETSSVNGENFVKGKPPVTRPATKVAAIEIDEKRIGNYTVGKRKVFYVTPSDYAKTADEDKPPASDLKLEFIFGYNGRSARANLYYAKQAPGKLIYCIAGTGVAFEPATGQQSFFNGHNEDILCLAVHPTRPIVATGQLDPKGRGKPYTCIWDYSTMTELARIDGFHDRGVIAAAFLPGGKYLATVGNDDSHTMGVFDWESDQKKPVAQAMVAKDEVFGFALNPHSKEDNFEFVTFGNKHLKYFTMVPTEKSGTSSKDPFVIKGSILSSFKNTGVVQKAFYCAAFDKAGDLVVGTHSGELYVFKAGQFAKSIEAHKNVVGAIIETPTGLASAGSDGLLIGWNPDMTKAWTLELGSKVKPKAIDVNENGTQFVVGTSNNSILDVNVEAKSVTTIMEGHSDEVWGCATHPSLPFVITCANDKTLRFWDVKTHKAVPGRVVTFKDSAICCNFSPDGKTIAVGFENGKIALVDSETLAIKYEKKHRAEQIAAVAFSPNGQLLAVGSWDQMAELIDMESKSSVTLKGHTSSVTHLSFSEDSKYLVTNSRDYEVLFWNTETGKRVDKTVVADVKWWDWQCILGFPVRGIFGAGQDGTDNNAAHASYNTDPAKRVIATGNDTGEVTLFRYPASQKGQKKYVGHSAHVTNVRFTRDDEYLVSTGGNDTGVFLWKHNPA